jgi:hypothetical protein
MRWVIARGGLPRDNRHRTLNFMRIITRRTLVLLLLLCLAAAGGWSQRKKYTGPRPPKPDVPYLLHATKLVETEVSEAKESGGKDGATYTVDGATSPARTPLPEPIFLFQTGSINPDRLSLYRMDVKGGARTVSMATGKKAKESARPIVLAVKPVDSGLFRIEVNEVIAEGEYCLSPEGSNKVFCFTVF